MLTDGRARARGPPPRGARRPPPRAARRAPGAPGRARRRRDARLRRPRPRTSRSRPCRMRSRTGAWRSPGPPAARWSSTPSTRARAASWRTSRTPTRPPGRNMVEGQAEPRRRGPRQDGARGERQALRARGRARGAARAPARPPPARGATCGWTAQPVAGAFMDFGLYVHRNAEALLERGWGPYFYIPKLESHHEAALWRDAFVIAEEALGLDRGTIKATVLIETIPAAFEMDAILYELRDHAAGLNAGPLGLHLLGDQALPLAARVRAARPLRGDDDRAVHARLQRAGREDLPRPRRARDGRHGGGDPVPHATRRRTSGVRGGRAPTSSARRTSGFDGTWVAHPDSVPVATEAFDAVLGERPNQVDSSATTCRRRPTALLDVRVHARARSPRRACART